MSRSPHRLACAAAAAGLLCAWIGGAPAAGQCPPLGSQSGSTLTQQFPPAGSFQTAWQISYGHATGKGLFITGASFRRGAGQPWTKVLYDARLSDIFVPYHTGNPRFFDLTGFSFNLVPVQTVDLGPCGQKADNFVVKEVRDRGMLWKNDTLGRRAYELVVWATLDAANYNYMIAYHFRDDGSIGMRIAATAVNLPGKELVAHAHDGLWRIDMDLDGAASDTVTVHRHIESTSSLPATDVVALFNGGFEGFADGNQFEFTMLNIRDEVRKNAQNKNWSYDLMLSREGAPRHFEAHSRRDFWVTRYDYTQMRYRDVTTYTNGQPITSSDVVIWATTPMHHMPRSEDGRFNPNWKGLALAMWTGLELRPRDLFDQTPYYP